MIRFVLATGLLLSATPALATSPCANASQSAGACSNCCILTYNCGQYSSADPTFQEIMAVLACRRAVHQCQRACLNGDNPFGDGDDDDDGVGDGGGAGGASGGDGGAGGEGGAGGDDEPDPLDLRGTVRLQLFIPYDGLLLPDPSLVGAPPVCIKADQRGFDGLSDSYRARADIAVVFPGDDDEEPSALVTQMGFGASAAYAWEDTEIDPDHHIFECRPSTGATPDVIATLPVSDDAFQVSTEVIADAGAGRIDVRFFIHANIPAEVFPVSPAIDAELLLEIERLDPETNEIAWRLTGSHDYFPAYELYFAQALLSESPTVRQIYGYSPADEGYGPNQLAFSQDVSAEGVLRIDADLF